MGKHEKILASILSARSNNSIRFSDLTSLLRSLGFTERVKGSHHIYYMQGIEEILNLQPLGAHAKAYQVRQVRNVILEYNMEEPNE